jgi:hypothetical protein
VQGAGAAVVTGVQGGEQYQWRCFKYRGTVPIVKPTVGILVRISDDREDDRKGVKRSNA